MITEKLILGYGFNHELAVMLGKPDWAMTNIVRNGLHAAEREVVYNDRKARLEFMAQFIDWPIEAVRVLANQFGVCYRTFREYVHGYRVPDKQAFDQFREWLEGTDTQALVERYAQRKAS